MVPLSGDLWCGIIVVEYLLWNLCFGFVFAESLMWRHCGGVLRDGIFIVPSLM